MYLMTCNVTFILSFWQYSKTDYYTSRHHLHSAIDFPAFTSVVQEKLSTLVLLEIFHLSQLFSLKISYLSLLFHEFCFVFVVDLLPVVLAFFVKFPINIYLILAKACGNNWYTTTRVEILKEAYDSRLSQ